MDSHAVADVEESSMESSILGEIKEYEKKADDIIERAKGQKESIILEAIKNSAKLLAERQEETRKAQDKRIMESRDKARLLKEEKLAEGKQAAKHVMAKSEKNVSKALVSVFNFTFACIPT